MLVKAETYIENLKTDEFQGSMSDVALECLPSSYPQLFRYKKNKRKKVSASTFPRVELLNLLSTKVFVYYSYCYLCPIGIWF